ncbi:hypothetical protein C2W62_05030 [Candidatus Entotheonella serta]|nr:hypothetical protein C2W62_05030 [Candidatus Entotheonella serta]
MVRSKTSFIAQMATSWNRSVNVCFEPANVTVLDEHTIHAISNPLQRKSYAIHVYGGDIVNRAGRSIWNPHTLEREPYDVDRLSAYVKEMMAG